MSNLNNAAKEQFWVVRPVVTRLMPLLLLALLIFPLLSCKKREEPKGIPADALKLRVVHGPELRSYFNSMREQFLQSRPSLPDGKAIDIELINDVGLHAAKNIADGSFKIDAWIAPSKSLVEYVNNSLSNLGARQVDCIELFETPVVVTTRAANHTLLGTTAGYIPLREMMTKEALGNASTIGRPAAVAGSKGVPVFFYHGLPSASATGLASFLQLVLMSAENPARLDAVTVAAPSFLEKLKALEKHVSSYSRSDVFLLHKTAFAGDSGMRLAITTEQQVALFNHHLGHASPSLVALYPQEGSFMQQYQLCMSDVDWVTPAHRATHKKWAAFLQQESSQRAAADRGFRPLAVKLPSLQFLSKQNGVNPELAHGRLADVRGAVLNQILSVWQDIERPLALLALIDTSGSMTEEQLAEAKRYIRELLARNVGSADLGALMTFSHEAKLVVDFTNDLKNLVSTLDGIQAVGGSALYDALRVATTSITRKELDNYRRAIVLITDGDDRNSEFPRVRLTNLLNEKMSFYDVNIAVAGISKPEVSYSELAGLAGETNVAFKEAQLDNFSAIMEEFSGNF